MSDTYAERARALVGTRFRPQGRSPETGLDCVGLALSAFDIPSGAVRRNYRLRGDHRAEIEAQLARFFRRVANVAARPGDLVLSSVTPDQFHLSIITNGGFVHADGGLGRVVETPGEPLWACAGTYRRRRRPSGR